jgi:hypothetical protein
VVRRALISIGLLGCGRVDFDPAIRLVDAKLFFDARPADLIPGLVAWYPLDDNAFPGSAVDASGNNRTAVCEASACPMPIAGKLGGAAAFDGASFRLRVPYDPGLDLITGFTVAAWARAEGFSQFHSIASKSLGPDTTNSWQLELPGILQMRLKIATDTVNNENLNAPMLLDAWTHVAGSWDGATARLYTNGVLAAEVQVPVVAWEPTDVFIGADLNQNMIGGFWDGRLDDVRIYGRALSDEDIRWLATP